MGLVKTELEKTTYSLATIQQYMQEYDSEDWKTFALYDEKTPYTRNLIHSVPKLFSLMTLCWNPNSSSPCHDHSGSECFMRLVQGQLSESRVQLPSKNVNTTQMKIGDVSYINDSIGFHSVTNPSKTNKACSLHLYIPPYQSCRCWNQNLPSSTPTLRNITFHSIPSKL